MCNPNGSCRVGSRCCITVEGSASFLEDAIITPPVNGINATVDEDDENDVDIFGEETREEKQSSILMDVKPWDDEPDMKKL
ncbi:unnamed protein product [Lactuca saligna]|uniref:Uncharacterized protein n=1 Tax=Lactuca saligna TaxID=75948 RepID=A0AA35ZLJ1_LACSI|nr:unnamed protein product [Lactuca saligna]